MRLFHLSDDPDVAVFHPRPSDYTAGAVVWAIEDARLVNYLLPRDCPRVCFRAGPLSAANEVSRFLGRDQVVIAIEAEWVQRLEAARLHCYAMPAATFTLHDAEAGYWISDQAVTPDGVETLADLPAALAERGATLRVLPSLWELHDAVRTSGLVYSMIRMRNAAPRP
jgi:hypothetical protein